MIQIFPQFMNQTQILHEYVQFGITELQIDDWTFEYQIQFL